MKTWKSLQNDDIIIDRDSSSLKLQMKRWKDECSLQLNIPVPTPDIIEEISPTKLQYSSSDFDVVFDKKDPSIIENQKLCENGGVEFTIVLKKKPLLNSWAMPINTKNLKFWYQAPLTQEEIDFGFKRPENVVGSYAVYKIDNKQTYANETEAIKYRVGKVFHIYRPKVWDSSASPKMIWADLNISGNTLTITVAQSFLNSAKYPVYIDPTFGYESAGGSSTPINGVIVGCEFANSSGAGDASKLTAYVDRGAGISSHRAKCAIYDDSDPWDLIQSTDEISNLVSGEQWKDFNFSSQPSISDSTTYAMHAWAVVDGGAGDIELHYDSDGPTVDWTSDATAYNGWPDPLAHGAEGTFIMSIYCTFAPSGYTLACDGGSYSLLGQTIDLLKGSKIDIAAGSYALSGQVVSLLKGSHIDLVAGSYSLSGQIVSLLKGSHIDIASGSYAITGQTITLLKDGTISIAAGGYTLTGQVANLLKGSLIAIASGAYTLTGFAVDLVPSVKSLEIDAGVYIITGSDVGLDYSGVTVFPIIFDVVPRGRILELVARTRIHNVSPRGRIFDRRSN